MREFFKGWRRKVGVLTLGLACLFAAGWVRSSFVMDEIECQTTKDTTHLLLSTDHSLLWQKRYLSQPEPKRRLLHWEFLPIKNLDGPEFNIAWHWRWHGFGVGDVSFQLPYISKVAMWIVPYWAIVIPLTLLAAFLLLIKPRKLTQKNVVRPNANEGIVVMGGFFRFMNCFFHGWGRKSGAVTLALALLILGVSFRSRVYSDQMAFASGKQTTDYLMLWNGYLVWSRAELATGSPPDFPEYEANLSHFVKEIAFDGLDINWKWYGLGTCKHLNQDSSLVRMWFVPDWHFIALLTSLSAFLLLSKPRKSNPKKITEPIQDEGGRATSWGLVELLRNGAGQIAGLFGPNDKSPRADASRLAGGPSSSKPN